MNSRHLISLSLLFATAACGSIPTQQFTFDAIDTGENPRPCMLVVNDDWPAAAEKNQYLNVESDDTLTLNRRRLCVADKLNGSPRLRAALGSAERR